MSQKSTQKAERDVEQIIKELQQYKGRGTQLVSLYIPSDKPISDVVSHITKEYGEAKNIKRKQTRKNVQSALSSIKSKLKYYRTIPENGLAIFSGVVDENTGQKETVVIDDLPFEITSYKYHCDDTFLTDPLEAALDSGDVYGLILLDRRTAQIGTLKGDSIQSLGTLKSNVMGKHRAGGQCLPPETVVSTPDGPQKIKNIESSETIHGYRNNEIITTDVKNKWTAKKPTFEVYTEEGQFEASPGHVVFYRDDEIKEKPTKDIEEGDTLIYKNENGVVVESAVKNKTRKEKSKKLFDIETGSQNFFANGFLVHNSSRRFDRLIEEALNNFFKKIAKRTNKEFTEKRDDIQGVIVGGPSPTKDEFLDMDKLHHTIDVLGVFDVDDTTERGLNQLVQKAENVISEAEIAEERENLEEFMRKLKESPGEVTYGVMEVFEALRMGAVDTVLMNESRANDDITKFKCKNGHVVYSVSEIDMCPKCKESGQKSVVSLSKSVNELANSRGSGVIYVSDGFEKGEQLKNVFGGIAALLRFETGNGL